MREALRENFFFEASRGGVERDLGPGVEGGSNGAANGESIFMGEVEEEEGGMIVKGAGSCEAWSGVVVVVIALLLIDIKILFGTVAVAAEVDICGRIADG